MSYVLKRLDKMESQQQDIEARLLKNAQMIEEILGTVTTLAETVNALGRVHQEWHEVDDAEGG